MKGALLLVALMLIPTPRGADDPPCGLICIQGCATRRQEERAECIRRFPVTPGGENWPARLACFNAADAREAVCKRACRAHCRRRSP